ncbi:unnamed protein product [Camellia sinensis]
MASLVLLVRALMKCHRDQCLQEGEGWIETDNNGNGNGGRKGNLVSGKQQYYDYIWSIVGAEDENSAQLWRIADRWIWH